MKNKTDQKNITKIAMLLKLALGTLVITPCVSQALTTIDDSNIGTYTNTGISATSDDITIQTTDSTVAPQINKTTAGYGVLVSNGKTIIIDSSTPFVVKTDRTGNYNSSYGVGASGSGTIHAKSDLQINLTDGTGLYLANEGTGIFDNKVTITGTGTSANSFIGIRGYNASSSIATTGIFNDEVNITSSGDDSMGISFQNANNPTAVGGSLTFNKKATVNMTGVFVDNVYAGVTIQQLPNANPNAGSFILFNDGLDVTTAGGSAIVGNQDGGSIIVNSGNNTNNIVSTNKNYNAIETIRGTINVNGKTNIEGDIEAVTSTSQGAVNLNLTDGSTMISKIENHSVNVIDGYAQGNIDIAISGTNSQWKVTGDSYIDSLTLADDAKVSFGYDYATPDTVATLDDTNSMTLTTTSLSGSGLFEMRTAIGTDLQNDLLKVTGSGQATGSHKIAINDSGAGSAVVTGNEQITLVETEGGGADFALTTQDVDVGQYRFNTLTKVTTRADGTEDWVLSGTTIPDEEENLVEIPPSNGNNGGSTQKPQLNNTAQNAANILNSSYLMSYVENQTLLQRMGQLRQSEGNGGDVWGRIYGGKLSSFNDRRLSGFDMDYYGIQLGVDRKIDIENGDLYYGIVGGMSRGNVDYSVGDGNTKSYYVGLYGTYQSESGVYVDGLVKYVRMDNEFNTKTGGGYVVKGSGDTSGFSIGAETGKRFYLGEASEIKQGWYLEPQAQLTYSHQGDATIKATNGLRTDLDSYTSLLGRATIIGGYTIVDNENPIDIYLKTGYVKEFDGETAYSFNHNKSSKEKYDFGGNWWDNGIGINMQLNKQHNFYADVVYSIGNKFDQKQLNAGYRYSF